MAPDLAFGIDPDLHNTSIVLLRAGARPRVLRAIVCHDDSLTGARAAVRMCGLVATAIPNHFGDLLGGGESAVVVVEHMRVYGTAAYRARDLMLVQAVSGAAVGSAAACGLPVLYPRPQEWKGEVPKRIHQARILSKLGLAYRTRGNQREGYCVPSSPWPGVRTGADEPYKHLVDAAGLALYGLSEADTRPRGRSSV